MKWNYYLKWGTFNERENFLVSWVSQALSEWMEIGRAAHEVWGMVVKVFTVPVSGIMFEQKFGEITKLFKMPQRY